MDVEFFQVGNIDHLFPLVMGKAVLGMWVGQSEQSVSQIFDEYQTVLNELRMAPVLLFNEADQLLGTRGKADGAVEKMYNNLQNLFLEGLERFAGILIATTNRRDLLDSAFTRRFTYKLELPPPDTALRGKIWASHLPLERLATGCDLRELAELELTGGKIRIVEEKAVRLAAWRGERFLKQEMLLELAREEEAGKLDRKRGRIGYQL
jgi:SpoVK/Ycf46/Vps4 family AAA+-type ATPase